MLGLFPGYDLYRAFTNPNATVLDYGLGLLAAVPPGKLISTPVKLGATLLGHGGQGVALKTEAVIAETLASKGNIISQHILTSDELLKAGEDFLGAGYKEIGKPGSGVFRSIDQTRQFRIDQGSLSGSHALGTPHGHLEVYAPGSTKPLTNNHIPFVE